MRRATERIEPRARSPAQRTVTIGASGTGAFEHRASGGGSAGREAVTMQHPWDAGDALPEEATSLVGRASEIRAARDALGRARLVTLTGPGGVGKTRVALRVARDLAGTFPDGVQMVELSGLRDGALLAETVAGAMGLRDSMAAPTADLLVECLRDRRFLLVLDTCEHLVADCAAFARRLLDGCSGLRLLVTSRQPLGLAAERVLPVPPLAVTAESGDAVELFVARALEAVPDLPVTATARRRIALLCRRLDGIPLAIELAAVRLRTLPLEGLVRRMDELFWLLGDGPSETPRHQALRTTVGWSHELCAPPERLLWARLSVFAGGFDLAMAERVCADERLDRHAVAVGLAGLVDKSVVHRTGDRYDMLDTLREYGAAWLEAVEPIRPLCERHRDCVAELARRAADAWLTDAEERWVRRLDAERDNVRAALEFCFTVPGEALAGLRLAGALWSTWLCRSRFTEGRYWFDRGLELVTEAVPERADALWRNAYLCTNQGDSPEAFPMAAEALALARRGGDEPAYARALRTLGTAATFVGEHDRAGRCFEEALAVMRERGLRGDLIMLHVLRGFHRARSGEPKTALAECDEALHLLRNAPNEIWIRSWAGYVKALAHWFLDDVEGCAREVRASLAAFRRIDDPVGLTNTFELLGWVFARRRQYAEGAVLLGAASRYPAKVGVPRLGDTALESLHEQLEGQARSALGLDRFTAEHERGMALTLDETVRFACGGA
ncbi:ATP-binding protein [Actinomadura fibrosa]|uniref:ATP-binding protein n=1 Tax=Actinomadura fibrosa TaxID=111802 RepID=A0ABW2Y001_9ACTN|nr:tetratricopeptide repeat protein [Actinomadura fibrosa]